MGKFRVAVVVSAKLQGIAGRQRGRPNCWSRFVRWSPASDLTRISEYQSEHANDDGQTDQKDDAYRAPKEFQHSHLALNGSEPRSKLGQLCFVAW
jgi:hypothetical protein